MPLLTTETNGTHSTNGVSHPKSKSKPCSLLRVQGVDIVEAATGEKVVLKGAGLGGHLNMENFITGFSGHEHQHRAAMLSVLGPEKYKYFFDRFLDYFFTKADAEFFASLGLNCIRIPFNYRHFEDDLNPGVYKQEGFDLLDRIVNLCSEQNLYVILDLHAVPGGQNQDWHSDTGLNRALFWEFKEFQDRMVKLWMAIATHYKGNPYIAGYNPLNEPADPEHSNLVNFYVRVEQAIRSVDPDHILFIDGNTYAMDFSRFPSTPLPNTVYACHDYSMYGFPIGEAYEGTAAQKAKILSQFERKASYMRSLGVPVWNGEFGPVYASAATDPNHTKTNTQRLNLLRDQLAIYASSSVSWSIWTYKDLGHQGMIHVDANSAYMRLLAPFLARKASLGLDFWRAAEPDASVSKLYADFIAALKAQVPAHLHDKRYPSPIWGFERQVERVLREGLMSEYMAWEMAELFRDKSEAELDELAASFKFENCVVRDGLVDALSQDAAK